MLNFRLTDEQLTLRDQARAFAMEHVLPIAWHYDEKDDIPRHILEKADQAGLINPVIPKAYGGKGYGLVEGALVTEEMAAACPGLATSIFANSLGLEPLILSENEALKQRLLPLIQNEFKLICFATSEPTMGSDVAGIRCRATEDGDSYLINGTKFWITNGGIADYISLFATVDPKLKHDGICAFVVEMNTPGISVSPPIPKMGQRCSNTVGIHFNNVRVPKKQMIAEPGKGFLMAMQTFSRTRPMIGAFSTGAARSAMEIAIDYAKKRRAFGMTLSSFQAIQFKLAEMYQKVETARLLTWKAAWRADQNRDPTLAASLAKFYASEAALEVASEALQILGGYGYTKMFPIEKLLRDIRLLRIYEGTSEIQRIVVSGYLLNAYKPALPPLEELPVHRRTDPVAEPDTEAWRCRICGHLHYGGEPPGHCPYCFFPDTAFQKCP